MTTVKKKTMKKIITLLCILILGLISEDSKAQTNPAAGDNQVQVEPGIFAIYSGDVNQDGTIDGTDYLMIDADIQNFGAGYIVTDLNGDGSVDGTDYLIVDANIQNFVGVILPTP